MRKPTKPITVRVRAVPTDRTDLVCVACGGFHSDYAITKAGGGEPQAGIHSVCLPVLRVKRGEAA